LRTARAERIVSPAMRKILIVLLLVVLMVSILWVVAGRQISSFVDRFKMVEATSIPVEAVSYQGSGDGGTLMVNVSEDMGSSLDLAPLNPHIGSSKDDQLAIAYGGKVFAFGGLRSSKNDAFAADVPKGSTTLFIKQSLFVWPSFNYQPMVALNRNHYYEFISIKSDGSKLRMLWSFDPSSASTNLIRIEITNAAR
jgi:hypothetical protein